jgi:hypothetical protein
MIREDAEEETGEDGEVKKRIGRKEERKEKRRKKGKVRKREERMGKERKERIKGKRKKNEKFYDIHKIGFTFSEVK